VLSSSSITLASPHHHSCPEVLLEDLQEVASPSLPLPRSFAPPAITILPPGNKLRTSPDTQSPLIPFPAPASAQTNECWVAGSTGTIPCRSCHASCAALIALTRRKQNGSIILIAGRHSPQLPTGSERSDAVDCPS